MRSTSTLAGLLAAGLAVAGTPEVSKEPIQPSMTQEEMKQLRFGRLPEVPLVREANKFLEKIKPCLNPEAELTVGHEAPSVVASTDEGRATKRSFKKQTSSEPGPNPEAGAASKTPELVTLLYLNNVNAQVWATCIDPAVNELKATSTVEGSGTGKAKIAITGPVDPAAMEQSERNARQPHRIETLKLVAKPTVSGQYAVLIGSQEAIFPTDVRLSVSGHFGMSYTPVELDGKRVGITPLLDSDRSVGRTYRTGWDEVPKLVDEVNLTAQTQESAGEKGKLSTASGQLKDGTQVNWEKVTCKDGTYMEVVRLQVPDSARDHYPPLPDEWILLGETHRITSFQREVALKAMGTGYNKDIAVAFCI